jgi:hypothetical protein
MGCYDMSPVSNASPSAGTVPWLWFITRIALLCPALLPSWNTLRSAVGCSGNIHNGLLGDAPTCPLNTELAPPTRVNARTRTCSAQDLVAWMDALEKLLTLC